MLDQPEVRPGSAAWPTCADLAALAGRYQSRLADVIPRTADEALLAALLATHDLITDALARYAAILHGRVPARTAPRPRPGCLRGAPVPPRGGAPSACPPAGAPMAMAAAPSPATPPAPAAPAPTTTSGPGAAAGRPSSETMLALAGFPLAGPEARTHPPPTPHAPTPAPCRPSPPSPLIPLALAPRLPCSPSPAPHPPAPPQGVRLADAEYNRSPAAAPEAPRHRGRPCCCPRWPPCPSSCPAPSPSTRPARARRRQPRGHPQPPAHQPQPTAPAPAAAAPARFLAAPWQLPPFTGVMAAPAAPAPRPAPPLPSPRPDQLFPALTPSPLPGAPGASLLERGAAGAGGDAAATPMMGLSALERALGSALDAPPQPADRADGGDADADAEPLVGGTAPGNPDDEFDSLFAARPAHSRHAPPRQVAPQRRERMEENADRLFDL
ncbi:hypothetical protein PAPYR_10159 [Paratrimastix pyriformis]|uniref:Uncharacterized protein n=1 Tax=Paratrimastix pyriformis TaxID=342808 RepID=A0ABQ8UCC0_9EUKA|nr:hypothetical protein PAPYR_10159 [Paratrimastix pyriformis]